MWITQISLITSVKCNWFNSEKYYFHWQISEKSNHWFSQWKFYWFRFREYCTNIVQVLYIVKYMMELQNFFIVQILQYAYFIKV